MSPSKSFVLATFGASVLLGSVSTQAAFYTQEFVNTTTGNIPVNSTGIDWKAYSGSTAADKSGTVDLSPTPRVGVSNLGGAPIGSTSSNGYLFTAHSVSGTHIFATFVEFSFLFSPTSMDWKMANTRADPLIVRVLVRDQTTGQWYASSTDYSTSADEGTSTNLQAGNFLNTHTFTTTASNWLNVTLNPGTALSVGSAPSSDLSGVYDRIGFVIVHPSSDTGGGGISTVRIDQVNIVPEPVSLSALLGGLTLLARRR